MNVGYQCRIMLKQLFALLGFAFICVTDAKAQANDSIAGAVKDSIVVRFNRNDFKSIYQLADTGFKKNISPELLVNFLKGNRSGGRIVRSSLQSVDNNNNKRNYLLELETRNMIMVLQVTSHGKFSSFGLKNESVPQLDQPKNVKTDNPLKTKLDKAIDSAAKEYFRYVSATGLSIGIIKDGKPYAYHYGEKIQEGNQLPTSETLYHIASITKTFTATLLAQGVIDGKLKLTDDIRTYLPDSFPNLQYNGIAITLQDMANHTSRLPSLPPDIGEQDNYDPLNPAKNYSSSMFYNALKKLKLDTLPGYKFEYSNWGIALLGHILERIYEQPYESLLKKYITGPLGMKSTVYKLPIKKQSDIATPYSEFGKQVPFEDLGVLGPAGGIYSNLRDMIIYLSHQINEKRPAIKLTHQPTANAMGLGWGAKFRDYYHDIQHNGSALGFASHISAFPELDSGCVILANNKMQLGKLIITIQNILKAKTY